MTKRQDPDINPKANGVAGHLWPDVLESWPDVIGMAGRIKSESLARYSGMRTVAVVQLIVAMIGLLCVFGTALLLSRSLQIAAVTVIIAFICSRLGDYAGLIRMHIWLSSSVMLIIFLMALAARFRSVIAAFASGASMVFAAGFLPTMVIAAPVTAVLFAFTPVLKGLVHRVVLALATLVGAAVCLLIAIDTLKIYEPAVLLDPLVLMLSERGGFHNMSPKDWVAGWLVPLPYTDRLATAIFGKEVVNHFGYCWSGTFVTAGLERFYEPYSDSHELPQLWLETAKRVVIDEFPKYLIVTPTLIHRGV